MGRINQKQKGGHGSEVSTLSPAEIQQLTPAQLIQLSTTQLSNLSQSQLVFVTIFLTKAVMGFANLSEIPDFVGSGLQNKVSQESRPTESISESGAVIVI